MVRMGSPVRFRRGAPHQTSRSGGVWHAASSKLGGRQLSFARDLPVRFAHCESVRAGSWDQATVPAGCSAASSTHSTLRTMRWGDRFGTPRRSSLGRRPGQVADDVGLPAGDPEHPSAADTDQDRRVRLLELQHPVDYRRFRWAVAETALVSATAALRQTPSCSQPSRCSSRFESSTGTCLDQRFMMRRHERSLSESTSVEQDLCDSLASLHLAIAGATMVPSPDGRPLGLGEPHLVARQP